MKQINLAKLNPERYLVWDRSVQNYLSTIDMHNDGSAKHSVTSEKATTESYRDHVWTNIQASLPEIIKRKVAHISRGNVVASSAYHQWKSGNKLHLNLER